MGILIHPVVFLEYVKIARKKFFSEKGRDAQEDLDKSSKIRIDLLLWALTEAIKEPAQVEKLYRLFMGVDVCWITMFNSKVKTDEKINLYSKSSLTKAAKELLKKNLLPKKISGRSRAFYNKSSKKFETDFWFCEKTNPKAKGRIRKDVVRFFLEVRAGFDFHKAAEQYRESQKTKDWNGFFYKYSKNLFQDAWKEFQGTSLKEYHVNLLEGIFREIYWLGLNDFNDIIKKCLERFKPCELFP